MQGTVTASSRCFKIHQTKENKMKNAKTFISGVLAGALAMSAPALANGVKQLIEAELNTVNITVDGV